MPTVVPIVLLAKGDFAALNGGQAIVGHGDAVAIARVEVGAQGADTRFIVTNQAGGKAKALKADLYCRRGAAENHIKSWKMYLAADRHSQSVPAVPACRRLLAHVGPARSDAETLQLCIAQFGTLRLRLIKMAARVVEIKMQSPARPAHPAHRPRSHSAARDIRWGADAPKRTR
ncbi:transposase [Mesorhizobium sp. C280B]|uniref:transposase n=1 Tax=unclassified Mesorhizobium TaxID=325217 RepID=UPI000408A70E|nr:transposase [Mesorhizobium sp. LSJC280B00]